MLADLTNKRLQNHPHPYQYALVDVSVADTLNTDPDDTWVSNLFVVDGQSGLRRAAGGQRGQGRRLGVQNQRRRAEVRMWRAAGEAGKTGRGGGHGAGGEILCNIVKRAWERLREGKRGKNRRKYEFHVSFLNKFADHVILFLVVLKLCPCWPPYSLTIKTGDFQRSYFEFESEGGRLRGGEVLHVWTAGARRRHTDLVGVGLPEGAVTGCSQPAGTNTV